MLYRNYRRTSGTLALMFVTGVCGITLLAPAQDDVKPATQPPAKPATAKPIEPATPAADLPDAEKLFEKAIEAMGGKDGKFDAIESMHVELTLSHPMMPAPINLKATRDNKDRFLLITGNPMGGPDSTIGSNGEVTWMTDPMSGGYKIADGAQKEMVQQQLEGQAILFRHDVIATFKDKAKEVKTVGSEQYAGEDAWRVHVLDKEMQEFDLFFSKETSLPLGMTATEDTGMGVTEIKVRFLEWKDFEPFKLYTKTEIEQGPMGAATITFDKIEVNKVDPKVFELPEEVKKLAEEKKDAPAPGETPPGGGSVPHDHDGDGKPDH